MYQSKAMKGLLVCGIATVVSFASCDSKKATEAKTEVKTAKTEAPSGSNVGRIAYVDMDTLQVKYEYLKAGKASLEKESEALQGELARMQQNLQTEAVAFQKKAQAGGFTSQADGEAAQMKLQKMQQAIEERKEAAGAALMKKTDAFTKELQTKLDKYLLKYNADKHFDYILQYQKGGTILFANPELDITNDVATGMNEDEKATK
jgi:outer membrane protein